MRKTVLNALFVVYLVAVSYLLWKLNRQLLTTFQGPTWLVHYGTQLAAILGGVLFRLDHLLGFCQNKEHQPVRLVVPSLVFGVLLLIISLGRFIFWQLWLVPLPQSILDIFSGSAFPLVEVSGFAGAALLLESWQRGPKRAASGGAPQEQLDPCGSSVVGGSRSH